MKNLGQMMKQAQQMQVKMQEMQDKLAAIEVTGNSGGGLVCLLTALRHPDVVRTLVLEEPAALTLFALTMPPRLADLLHLITTRPRSAIAFFRFVFGTLIRSQKAFKRGEEEKGLWIFVRGVLGKKPIDQMPKEVTEQFYENRNELRALMLNPDPEFPPLGDEAVRNMRAPVLLVTGELSPAFALRITDRLEELLPTVERVEISEASHIMHAEKAAAVNEAIIGFLGRHRARSMSPSSP